VARNRLELTPTQESLYRNLEGKEYPIAYVKFRIDADFVEIYDIETMMMHIVQPSWLELTPADHDFPNTGARRSWCKCCGAVGEFNWRSGSFE